MNEISQINGGIMAKEFIDREAEIAKQEAVTQYASAQLVEALGRYGKEDNYEPDLQGLQSKRHIEKRREENLVENFAVMDKNGDFKITAEEAATSQVFKEEGIEGLKNKGISGSERASLTVNFLNKDADGQVNGQELSSLFVEGKFKEQLDGAALKLGDKTIPIEGIAKLAQSTLGKLEADYIMADSEPKDRSAEIRQATTEANKAFVNGIVELAENAKPEVPNALDPNAKAAERAPE